MFTRQVLSPFPTLIPFSFRPECVVLISPLSLGELLDILHSYLGLAALSIINEPGLKKIDSALCISVDAKEHIMRMPWSDGSSEEAIDQS